MHTCTCTEIAAGISFLGMSAVTKSELDEKKLFYFVWGSLTLYISGCPWWQRFVAPRPHLQCLRHLARLELLPSRIAGYARSQCYWQEANAVRSSVPPCHCQEENEGDFFTSRSRLTGTSQLSEGQSQSTRLVTRACLPSGWMLHVWRTCKSAASLSFSI